MFKFLVIVSATVLSTVLSYPFNACIGKCPESKNPCKNPTLLAHQDCTKYCFCNDGCPMVKKCPGNFHFSLDERMCLPVELAKCDDRRNCLGMCPIVYNTHNVLLLPHSNSSKFCHCREWGVPTVETCPESLVFNSVYGQCVKPNPDCHHRETEAPTVGSTGVVVPPTIPPIRPVVLDDPVSTSESHEVKITAAPKIEDSTPVKSEIDVAIPTVASTSETHEVKITAAPKIEDSTPVKSEIDVAIPTVALTSESHEVKITAAPKIEDSTPVKSEIDVAIPTVASTSESHEVKITAAPKIEGSTPVKSEIDVAIPTVASTSESHEVKITAAPKIEGSTPVKSEIDVAITTVASTSESHEKITAAPKIEDSTSLKTDVDVIIPTVASTSKSIEVEMTAEPKTEDPTTSNHPKLIIVPCNCTQTVFSDNNPSILKEKVHIDDNFSSNVEHCIGQCPLVNNIHHTTHLPHLVCTQYCKCDWGKPTVMRCPDDLHFNRKLQVCDYPVNANCSGIRAH